MSVQQEIDAINERINKRLAEKYAKGAAEHNGNLYRMSALELLKETRDELIDAIVYVDRAIKSFEDK